MMEADKMSCICGGIYIWVKELNALVCANCGRHSPYQPKPKYEELLEENERLKAEIKAYKMKTQPDTYLIS